MFAATRSVRHPERSLSTTRNENGANSTISTDVTHNDYGGFTYATTRVANTMITNNGVGVSSALLGENISFGNNRLDGNAADGTFDTTIPTE